MEPTDISSLSDKFKEEVDLKSYSHKQFEAMLKAIEKIKQLEDENLHLRELLQNNSNTVRIFVPAEQLIIETQINMIKERGLKMELSFEDTKRLEVLVKTLKIIKENPAKAIDPNFSFKKNLDDAQLVALAKIENKSE